MDGIEGSTLLDLVADNPEGEAIVIGEVLADATDIDGILAGQEERHRVFLLGGVVLDDQTFGLGKGGLGFGYTDGALGLYQMASEWERKEGTRTQVALTRTSLCMILRVSLNIFISSLV